MPADYDIQDCEQETALLSEALLEKIASNDPMMMKTAEDAINDFIRKKVREDGFTRRIMPAVPIANSDLDRQLSTSKPVKIVDIEADSPASVTVPFEEAPSQVYIRGNRFAVHFCRIRTPMFTADVDTLRTWKMDIRQVISDNAVRDIMAAEDANLIRAVNTILIAAEAVVPTSGVAQWRSFSGGVSRDNLVEAQTVLQSTPESLNARTLLVNNVTRTRFGKFGRDETGGDMSQDMLIEGWTRDRLNGSDLLTTIKRTLVADNTMYMFADPKFMGKFYELEATTMFVERKAYFIKFFAYESIGATIANTSAVGRVDFGT